jgi:hypothetical protein
LIIAGVKKEEYRSRRTNITGRVYVYASKTPADDHESWEEWKALPKAKRRGLMGVLVGSVEIYGCDGEECDYVWLLVKPKRMDAVVPVGRPQPGIWRGLLPVAK